MTAPFSSRPGVLYTTMIIYVQLPCGPASRDRNYASCCSIYKHSSQRVPHHPRRLCCIYSVPQTLLLVVLHDRSCLLVERTKSFAERLHVVVRPLDQRFACHVIRHRFLRRTVHPISILLHYGGQCLPELPMVRSPAGWVDKPSSNPGYEQRIINLQLHNRI